MFPPQVTNYATNDSWSQVFELYILDKNKLEYIVEVVKLNMFCNNLLHNIGKASAVNWFFDEAFTSHQILKV